MGRCHYTTLFDICSYLHILSNLLGPNIRKASILRVTYPAIGQLHTGSIYLLEHLHVNMQGSFWY